MFTPQPLSGSPFCIWTAEKAPRHCQPQASAQLECVLRGSRVHPKLLVSHFMSHLRGQIFAAWTLCGDSRQEALLGPLLHRCDWSLRGPEGSPSGNPQICASCLNKA